MSLTSILRSTGNQDIRDRFNQEFEKPALSDPPPIQVPSCTSIPAIIGIAFDYLFRFHLEHVNANAVASGRWAAEYAAEMLRGSEYYGRAERIIEEARACKTDYIESGQVSDELILSALGLGRLDPYYRSGRGCEYIGSEFDDGELSEVKQLMDVLLGQDFRSTSTCVLNPTFGYGTVLVGGADADALIDDTLWEVKTTKHCKLSRRDFNQMIGYYLLHLLNRGPRGVKKLPSIKRLGIYFARYGWNVEFPVRDVIDDMERIPEILRWFEERVSRDRTVLGRVVRQ